MPNEGHSTSTTAVAADGERPLKILIAGDTFTPNVNGAAKFTEHLASGMAARGHDVHVIVPAASRRHGTWTEEYDGQKVTAHRLRSHRWWAHDWLRYAPPWHIRAESERVVDEVRPDVVHFQSAVIIGRGVAIEAEKRGIRIIGTNHLMIENLVDHSLLPQALRGIAASIWWKDARSTLGRASAITTPTRRAADFLEANGGISDVLAISCGIRTSDYTFDFSPRESKRILFVGRVTGEKKIDVLLRALTLLPSDVGLDIVGGGDQKKNLQSLAKQLGLADRVTFHGYLSDQELRRMYTRASVFAMPSIAELQSIATMEAMASGQPVVAADAMALPHLVHDGENGFLFEPNNERDLADKLSQVLALSSSEREEMARAGLDLVRMHDIDRTLELFERLYRGASVKEVARDSVNEQDHSLD
ncbi:glycosyltransferase [Pseudoclavibacter sp. AY1F1]|uniref:glycosyltransferase n=1 Tax=Pseudoclavibacter sp. AY1F1 TaxID=2080583 RepID=UPI0021584EB0|nr:glycosyltransferase [Pseudoclavibacter sp. AY1F1]